MEEVARALVPVAGASEGAVLELLRRVDELLPPTLAADGLGHPPAMGWLLRLSDGVGALASAVAVSPGAALDGLLSRPGRLLVRGGAPAPGVVTRPADVLLALMACSHVPSYVGDHPEARVHVFDAFRPLRRDGECALAVRNQHPMPACGGSVWVTYVWTRAERARAAAYRCEAALIQWRAPHAAGGRFGTLVAPAPPGAPAVTTEAGDAFGAWFDLTAQATALPHRPRAMGLAWLTDPAARAPWDPA